MGLHDQKGQNAIEYLLLLALVAGIVLVALQSEMPTVRNAANVYYNRASELIIGDAPVCGDGICGPFELDSGCCIDCPGC